MTITVIITWNEDELRAIVARKSPSAENASPVSAMTPSVMKRCAASICRPIRNPSRRTMMPCIMAMAEDDTICPMEICQRETGDTMISFMKPLEISFNISIELLRLVWNTVIMMMPVIK